MFFVLVLIFLVWLFYLHEIYGRRGRLLQLIPGPPGLPIIGNMYHMLNCSPEKVWDKLITYGEKYDPIWKMYFPFVYTSIAVNHPNDLEILLKSSKHIDKGRPYKYLRPWLKMGLLNSSGVKWRVRRKILTSAFHFNILNKYLDVTDNEAKKSIEKLNTNEAAKESEFVISLMPFISDLTLNIISESAMGVNINEVQSEETSSYKQAIFDMGQIMIYRMGHPHILNALFHPLINRFAKLHANTLKILNRFSTKIIQERRDFHFRKNFQLLKILENIDENISDSGNAFVGRQTKLSMLDLLLSAQQDGQIDESGIQEEVDTFIFEGHETTGMGITYLLLLLAENQEHQEKARQEVNEVLSNSNGKLSVADLKKLHYLGRCIKESLRLFPTSPIIVRHITEDLQLTNYVLPAGSDIYVSFYKLHRRPDFWPEPTKFDPDRFLPSEIQNRHPFSYLPFSAGPRNCIGQKFAMNELKAITARILHHYYLKPITKTKEIKFTTNLTLKPTHPLYVKLIKITP